jgi:hypothetical protein
LGDLSSGFKPAKISLAFPDRLRRGIIAQSSDGNISFKKPVIPNPSRVADYLPISAPQERLYIRRKINLVGGQERDKQVPGKK